MDYKNTIITPKTDFPMRAGLPTREPPMLEHWNKIDVYSLLLKKNEGKPAFILHDGPPFSNGDIHMGHALNKTLKDFIIRSYAMRGYYTPYTPGWDNHGMPIESAIIKKNKLNHKTMPVTEFRSACESFAEDFIQRQMAGFRRLGVMGDWAHPYRTMDRHFEAEEVKVFGEMYRKGYIYKGLKPVYWCPKDETALAEAEIEYQDDPCTTVYVKFPMQDDLGKLPHLDHSKLFFVIWTTTIWTLPGNMGISLHPRESYAVVKADNGELYRYAGTATVTYVDAPHKRVYAGDMSGALCVDFSYVDMATLPLAVGDKFTGVLCMITKEQGVPYLMALSDVTKKGTGTKSPLEVSAAALQQDPESYIHRLVTLTDEVSFGDVAEGETFTSAARRGTAGDKRVTILPFAGTDLIGATVPQKATVTGIVRKLSIISLSPRSVADVEGATAPVEEPKLSVTAEQLLPDMLGHVGESVALARFTVSATDMTNATEVYITGKDRAMFSTDVTSIPAGTSTTEVTVTYTPTAIGKHTGRINFDAVPTELSTGTNFTVVAIDPNNLPNVSADTSELTPFEAAVGKTQEQTVAVTTAFCPDYGTAKIVNATGAFRINSTSLLKEGVTQLKITFAPNQAGTFTDTIELTAPYGNTVTFKVTGTATAGSVEPGETEGDTDFTLDTTAPLTFYTQDFETDDAQNKPIHVEQWKNFAFEGTRAWWSYTEADGNKAAKATAYDFYGGTGVSVRDDPGEPGARLRQHRKPLPHLRPQGSVPGRGDDRQLQCAVYGARRRADPRSAATGQPADRRRQRRVAPVCG